MSAATERITNILQFKIDGAVYSVDLFGINGSEWRDAKRASGLLQSELVDQAAAGEVDAVATLVWIVRRREEPDLDYEDVLVSITVRPEAR